MCCHTRDLNGLEMWADRKLMNLNKEKSLGEEQTHAPICVGGQQTRNILAEKDLRILVDAWLNMRQKCAAKKGNSILKFIRRSVPAD